MGKHPVVSKCRVSKTLLGGWKIDFDCPACRSPLNTKDGAIGTVDNCQLCGAQFVISPNVRDQIAAAESQAAEQKREEANRKKEADAARREAKWEAETARREEEAQQRRERDEQEHNRGYDYPNLRKYQARMEATAIVAAVLLSLLGVAALAAGLVLSRGYTPGIVAGFLIALTCFLAAASAYLWWMVVAEMLRLIITVALDVRAIRDGTHTQLQSKGHAE